MKIKVLLTFPADLTDRPITYRLVKDFDLQINILRASIEYNIEGKLLLELQGPGEAIDKGITFLKQQGINVDLFKSKIKWAQEECVHCGACTAVCSSSAFCLNHESWLLEFSEEKCLGCGLCVKACPLKIIEVTI